MAIEVFGRTIKGSRKKQEDDLFYQVKGNSGMAVACDGIGGMSDGDWASYIAVKLMKKHYNKLSGMEDISGFFYDEIKYLNDIIYNLEDDNHNKLTTGTTLVSTIIKDGALNWASVGDSRIYLYEQKNKSLRIITREHNYKLKLDEALSQNIITRDEYDSEIEKADALISYLGLSDMQIFDVSMQAYNMEDKDAVVLCTDGIFKALSDDEINEVLNREISVREMVDCIIDNVLKKHIKSQDNATVIIMKYRR